MTLRKLYEVLRKKGIAKAVKKMGKEQPRRV